MGLRQAGWRMRAAESGRRADISQQYGARKLVDEGKRDVGGWRKRNRTNTASWWDKANLKTGLQHLADECGTQTEISPDFQQAEGNVFG